MRLSAVGRVLGQDWVVLRSRRFLSDDVAKRQLYDQIIRVDHAGEFAANRIYEGQMAVLGRSSSGSTIQHMWDQEKVHLDKFKELIGTHRVRPTIMLPIWNVAAFVLGAGSALLGKEAAMACTTAVEETIVKHYDSQIRELMMEATSNGRGLEEHKELLDCIKQFRDEEEKHHDIGKENDSEKAPFHDSLTELIKLACKGGIWISKRI